MPDATTVVPTEPAGRDLLAGQHVLVTAAAGTGRRTVLLTANASRVMPHAATPAK